MDDFAYQGAQKRKDIAGARAVGMLRGLLQAHVLGGNTAPAAEIIGAWDTAHAEQEAAIVAPNREAA